jgi:hypothetical protein
MSEEEAIKEKEEKVLFPETHVSKIKFLGKDIDLTPLPFAITKKLRSVFKEIQKKLSVISIDAEHYKKDPEGLYKRIREFVNSGEDIDFEVAIAILDSMWILASYYKLGIESKEKLNDVCSLTEAQNFVDTQFKLQEENDFLLRPLVLIMKAICQVPTPLEEEKEILQIQTV